MDGQSMDAAYNIWYNHSQYPANTGWHSGSYYYTPHHQQQQNQQHQTNNSQPHQQPHGGGEQLSSEQAYYQGYGYIYNTYMPSEHTVSSWI